MYSLLIIDDKAETVSHSCAHHSSSWSCALFTCCLGLSGSSGAPVIGGICCGSSSGLVPSLSSACWRKRFSTLNTKASITKETTVGRFSTLSCLWYKFVWFWFFLFIFWHLFFSLYYFFCSARGCDFCRVALCTQKISGSNPGPHCKPWLWHSQVS